MNQSNYPYQNHSLGRIKGEVWKDMPGFEGYYQVSSFGRVKSLDRVIPHPRWGRQYVEGKMLVQQVKKTPNLKTQEPSIALQVALSREGRLHYRNVKRMVYAAFVKEIDYESDGLYVINKNGDGYDNRINNLKLVTKSEKGKRAFQLGRADAEFLKTADRSKWNRPPHPSRKPVRQLNLKGKLIALYESIGEASRRTGCGEKEIILVAKGIHRQSKGYRWEYAKK